MNFALRCVGFTLAYCVATQGEATVAIFFGDGPTGTGEVFGNEFIWEASPNLINPVAEGGEDFLSWGESGNPNSRGLDFDITVTFPEPLAIGRVIIGGLNNVVGGSELSVQMFDLADSALDLSLIDDESTNGLASSGWTYDAGNRIWSHAILLGSVNPHDATLVGPIAGVKSLVVDVDDNFGLELLVLDILPPSADFNGDNDVDGIDFLAWQRGFGIPSGATKAQGDADNNATVDSADLALWELQYGTAPPTSAAVPEPTTCTLAALCLAMSRRRIAAR